MAQHQLSINFVHGNAEAVPCDEASFDFAISEYGAAIWCDPYVWIPEAHRLLRKGGKLVFLGCHPLTAVCMPASGDKCEEKLHNDYFGLHKQDWRNADADPGGIEFNLSISDWLRLFRSTGFEVVNYLEIQAPADQNNQRFFVTGSWARRWPSEQVWCLRKH